MEQAADKVSERRFSEKEAAKILQVSPMTIRRHRESGILGFYQIGRRIFVGESHILKFLKNSEKNAN